MSVSRVASPLPSVSLNTHNLAGPNPVMHTPAVELDYTRQTLLKRLLQSVRQNRQGDSMSDVWQSHCSQRCNPSPATLNKGGKMIEFPCRDCRIQSSSTELWKHGNNFTFHSAIKYILLVSLNHVKQTVRTYEAYNFNSSVHRLAS